MVTRQQLTVLEAMKYAVDQGEWQHRNEHTHYSPTLVHSVIFKRERETPEAYRIGGMPNTGKYAINYPSDTYDQVIVLDLWITGVMIRLSLAPWMTPIDRSISYAKALGVLADPVSEL
jgi:hypothetical protein